MNNLKTALWVGGKEEIMSKQDTRASSKKPFSQKENELDFLI